MTPSLSRLSHAYALLVLLAWLCLGVFLAVSETTHLPFRADAVALVLLGVGGALSLGLGRARRANVWLLAATVTCLPLIFVVQKLNQCSLLLSLASFTERQKPWPVGACCESLRGVAACRSGFRTGRLMYPAKPKAEPTIVERREREESQQAAAEAERSRREAIAREEAAQRERTATEEKERLAVVARLRAVGARLVALRSRGMAVADPCTLYSEVGPAKTEEERMRIQPDSLPHYYQEVLQNVRCLPTRSGAFVPVDDQGSWSLWFVPQGDDPPRPISQGVGAQDFSETDMEFSSAPMFAEDVDGDGAEEAVLSRGWEHPEGVGSARSVLFAHEEGTATETLFASMKDVDHDGMTDGLIDFSVTTNSLYCHDDENPDDDNVWNPVTLNGPTLVAHQSPRGHFTISDAVAKKERSCKGPTLPIVVRDRTGRINEDEMYTRAVCRAADGESPGELRRVIEEACVEISATLDCPKPRPNACAFRSIIMDSFAFASQYPLTVEPNHGKHDVLP